MKLKELCFEITNSCYLNCIYCSSFDDIVRKNCSEHLPIWIIKRVIDDFSFLGGELLELSGGEPLLHPQIFEIVDYALNKELEVIIYTSGVLPETYNFKDILIKLLKIGLKKIVFNCQGLDITHDNLVRKEGAFSKLVESIKSSKDIGIWVGVHFVPNKQNFTQVESVFSFLEDLGVDELAFLRLVKQGRASKYWDKLEMKGDEYFRFFECVRNLSKRNSTLSIKVGCPFDFMYILYSDWKEIHQCHAGKSSLNIIANGEVIPCPAFKDIPVAKVGNIFNDSLEKIWNESDFLDQLRKLSPSQISFCNKCPHLNKCKGRCTAQRLLKNGSIEIGPDPLCKKMRLYELINEKNLKKTDSFTNWYYAVEGWS